MTNGNMSLGYLQDHTIVNFEEGVDMQGMLEHAFEEFDEPPPHLHALEKQFEDIAMGAFTIVDKLGNVGGDGSNDGSEDEILGDNGFSNPKKGYHKDPRVLEETMEELYHGAKLSIHVAIIQIITLCMIHGVSNNLAVHIFTFILKHIFPNDKELPKNYHAAKALIQKLGLIYNTIYACQAGCVLFKGQYGDATCCPKCKKPWYKDEVKK